MVRSLADRTFQPRRARTFGDWLIRCASDGVVGDVYTPFADVLQNQSLFSPWVLGAFKEAALRELPGSSIAAQIAAIYVFSNSELERMFF